MMPGKLYAGFANAIEEIRVSRQLAAGAKSRGWLGRNNSSPEGNSSSGSCAHHVTSILTHIGAVSRGVARGMDRFDNTTGCGQLRRDHYSPSVPL